MSKLTAAVVAIAIGFVPGAALAQTQGAVDAGHIYPNRIGGGVSLAGTDGTGPTPIYGFLKYDIERGGVVTSATMQLRSSTIRNGPNTIAVVRVTTPYAALRDNVPATYADVASGPVYATAVASNDNELLDFTLSADAVAAINSARGGAFVIGLVNQSITSNTDYVFGNGGNKYPQDLILVRAAATPSPTITALSTSSGPQSGGTTVVITGANFNSSATVTFDGVPATSLVVTSTTQIVAISPAHAPGAVRIQVLTDQGVSADTAADDFAYLDPTPVPTLSEWAMIVFGLFLAGGAAVMIRRRLAPTSF